MKVRGGKRRVATALLAGALALAAAPTAALADEPVVTTDTRVGLARRNAAEGEAGSGDDATTNISVNVPVSIPLAADASGAITGPSNVGFTNLGARDVSLKGVTATLNSSFAAVSAAAMRGGPAADNAVYLRVVRAADPANADTAFTLDQAATTGVAFYDDAWRLAVGGGTDLLRVDAGSKIANVAASLETSHTLCTLNWSFGVAEATTEQSVG